MAPDVTICGMWKMKWVDVLTFLTIKKHYLSLSAKSYVSGDKDSTDYTGTEKSAATPIQES